MSGAEINMGISQSHRSKFGFINDVSLFRIFALAELIDIKSGDRSLLQKALKSPVETMLPFPSSLTPKSKTVRE